MVANQDTNRGYGFKIFVVLNINRIPHLDLDSDLLKPV